MYFNILIIVPLITAVMALPSLKRQGSACQPGDELACCAAENDGSPVMGSVCQLTVCT